jgi:hypothetical protein
MVQLITRVVFFLGLLTFFVSCQSKAEETAEPVVKEEQPSDLKELNLDSEPIEEDCQHYCKFELPK